MRTSTLLILIMIVAVAGIGAYYIFSARGVPQTPGFQAHTNPTVIPAAGQSSSSTSKNSATNNNSGNTSDNGSNTKGEQSQAVVAVQNFSFLPQELHVKAGTVVTWTNDDPVPHTITSDNGGLLASLTLTRGLKYSVMLTQKGTFTYHCAIHPNMRGTIIVE